MLRLLAHVLLTLVVALVAMPVSARTMQMSPGMAGMPTEQFCPSCPHEPSGSTNPAKMPACQMSTCACTVAMLPLPTLLPGRTVLRATHLSPPPVHWADAANAPDPFPPKPTAHV